MNARRALIGVLVVSLLLIAGVFLIYRGRGWPFDLQAVEALAAAIVVIGALAATLVLWRADRGVNDVIEGGIRAGLAIGVIWTLEIALNNVLQPPLPDRDIEDDVLWALVAVLLLATSTYYAARTRRFSAGVAAGVWSGLASGAVACLTALLFIVLGMGLLTSDPLNLDEWAHRGPTSGTPDISVYLAYQTLAGAILHLVVLGVAMGLVLGIIGGALGKALGSLRTPPTEVTQAV